MTLINQKIDFFEQYADESILLDGESLYDQNSSINPKKLKNSEWLVTLRENRKNIQVKIKISRSKIRSFHCSCLPKNPNIECRHTITGLLAIRKNLDTHGQKDIKQSADPIKLNLDQILGELSKTEIEHFVKYYSRKDRKFRYLFKARFFKLYHPDPNVKHYLDFFDDILMNVSGNSRKYSAARLRIYLTAAADLESQLDDLITLQQFTEASQIIIALLQKHIFLSQQVHLFTDKTHKKVLALHKKLADLFHCDMAPELKEKLWAEGFSLAEKSYYHIPDVKHNFFEILIDHQTHHKKLQKLAELVLLKSEAGGLLPGETSYFLALQIHLSGINADISQKIAQLRQDQLIQLCKMLLNKNHWKIAEQILLKSINLQSKGMHPLEDLLLDVYRTGARDEQYFQSALEFYLQRRDHSLLDQILNHKQSNLALIEKIIREKGKYNGQGEKLAAFYYKIGNSQALYDEIVRADDFSLAMKFDDLLFEDFESELVEYYTRHICKFIKNHAGRPVIDEYERLTQHLIMHKKRKMVSLIRDKIRQQFAHRKLVVTKLLGNH